jgi:hypothetical protein
MWFAKLFGGSEEDDSEPSEFPPHAAAGSRTPALTDRPPPQHQKSSAPAKGRQGKGKGFDPYNSGTFDKNRAWEKVIR